MSGRGRTDEAPQPDGRPRDAPDAKVADLELCARLRDVWTWSQRQARLLRAVADGAGTPGVDWPGVIAEIEAVGVTDLTATRLLLRQAMALLLQIHGWPEHADRPAWLVAVGGALGDLAIRLTPGMRQQLDLESLYQLARAQFAGVALDGQLARPFPSGCPFSLDDLLRADRAQLDALLVPNEEL